MTTPSLASLGALDNGASLRFAAPELILSVGLCLVLLLGLLHRTARRSVTALTLLVCAAAATSIAAGFPGSGERLFQGLLIDDGLSALFKLLTVLTLATVTILAIDAPDALPRRGTRPDPATAEFHMLLLLAGLGVFLMVSAADLLVAYLGLELVSLMSYVLAGFIPGSPRAAEGALKYTVYGAVASACLLFGFSIFFGLTGLTDFSAFASAAATGPAPLVMVAAALCLVGLGYKIAIAPFHQWCPDVFEGAPTLVAAFLSAAPKIGGFALLLRLFSEVPAIDLRPTQGLTPDRLWPALTIGIGIATMTLGNLAALVQTNLKRLLAYSSIAHAGTMFLALAVGPTLGPTALAMYLPIYLLMNLTAFAALTAARAHGVEETLQGWGGLGRRMPLVALGMTIALFALAGLPPTAGFVAKYYIFSALFQRGQDAADGGSLYYVAALVGVSNGVLALAYYARILRAMYFAAPSGAAAFRPRTAHVVALVALALPTLFLGLYWSPLIDLVQVAVGPAVNSGLGLAP